MQLSVIVGSTTYSLTDGNPYSLESATGLGIAPVQRRMSDYIGAAGAIDYGYTLSERIVTLALLFEADSDAQLDGYRNNLQRVFAPGTNAPLVLRVVRDDGQERRLDVVASGLGFLALDATHRPGHLHRCVVQLRAAEPTWYGGTGGTLTFGTSTIGTLLWYLASGTIANSSVMQTMLNVPENTTPEWDRNLTVNSDFTIAITAQSFSSFSNTSSAAGGCVFWIRNSAATSRAYFRQWGGTAVFYITDPLGLEYTIPVYSMPDLDNAFYCMTIKASKVWFYFEGTALLDDEFYVKSPGWMFQDNLTRIAPTDNLSIFHPVGWGTVHRVVFLEEGLSSAQVSLLRASMQNDMYIDQTFSGTISAPDGDNWIYPSVSLRGYMADPIVKNTTTGGTLDMTGSTIPANVTYTLNMDGDAVYMADNGGTIRTFGLSDDSAIGDFAIQPGTPNVIQLSTSEIVSNAAGSITYGSARYTGV